MTLFTRVRPEERRLTIAAFATIALVLIAHAILETARDALFLINVPPSRLPWLYLGLAGLMLAGRPLLALGGASLSRASLVAMQVAAALGTAIFALVVESGSGPVFYALYLWGGLAGMVTLIRLWLLLSVRCTASQAKRLFPYVASGAVLGGLIGYGGTGLLAPHLAAHDLLGLSAIIFLCSAGATLLWPSAAATHAAPEADRELPVAPPGLRESLAIVARHAYVRRVAAAMLLASIAMTLVDFTFKNVVAHSVSTGALTGFLAGAYFSFDLVSLLLLLTVVGPLVRWAGVTRALAVRPAVLIAAGAAVTAVGGLWPVLAMRGVDGALRGSLHKTAAELLYVPMSARLRTAVKELGDGVAHRGGQALGSLLILIWLAASGDARLMGPIIVVGAAAWMALAVSLRVPYLNLFRETLSDAASRADDDVALDLASLETTIAALNSPDDARVLAGLDLLAERGRTHLIPALILYHPAPAVVVRALEHCGAGGRDDVLPLCDRLLEHADGAVRGAAMRTIAQLAGDREVLRGTEASCPIVACTGLIAAAGRGWLDADTARRRVLERWRDGDAADDGTASAIARALRAHPQPAFAELLGDLAKADATETRREALRAIGALRDPVHLPAAVAMLAAPELREDARAALLAYGDAGLDHLEAAWDDPALPHAVRVHLPRTISRFTQPRVADLLLQRLLVEPSGMVRYKILRGLGRKVAENPDLSLDEAVLDRIIERHLDNVYQLLARRMVLQAGGHGEHAGHRLLIELLRQKESFAIERIFRVLGMRYPRENVAQIYDGLRSAAPESRSSSRELLEHLLPTTVRAAIVGLTDDVPDAERLAAGPDRARLDELTYTDVLAAMRADGSPVLSSLAEYHAAEIGLAADTDRRGSRAHAGDDVESPRLVG